MYILLWGLYLCMGLLKLLTCQKQLTNLPPCFLLLYSEWRAPPRSQPLAISALVISDSAVFLRLSSPFPGTLALVQAHYCNNPLIVSSASSLTLSLHPSICTKEIFLNQSIWSGHAFQWLSIVSLKQSNFLSQSYHAFLNLAPMSSPH